MEQVITFSEGDGGEGRDGGTPLEQTAKGSVLRDMDEKLDAIMAFLGISTAKEDAE